MKNLYLLFILLFFEVSNSWPRSTQTGSNPEKQYLSKIEHEFNRQNFDSCIYYSYLLANHYNHQKDSAKLTDIWYSISYLYLLQDLEKNAKISLNMARHFQTSRMLFKKKYEALYQGINDYHKGNYSKALITLNQTNQNMLPACNRRLNKLVQLYVANSRDQGNPPEKNFAEVNKYLSNLKLAKDTNWFGYPLGYFFVGKAYYLNDKTDQAIIMLQRCISNFERLWNLRLNWIQAYSLLIYVYGQNYDLSSQEIYFKRINSKINSKALSPSEWIEYNKLKASYFYNQSNFQEALEIYLNIINRTHDNQDQTEVIEKIIWTCGCLNKYRQVIDWYEKADPKMLHNYSKIIAANCYFLLGFHQKATNLIAIAESNLQLSNLNFRSDLIFLIQCYIDMHDYEKAEHYSKIYLSKTISKFGKSSLKTFDAYSRLANLLFIGKSDYSGSLEYFKKALYTLISCPDTSDIFQIPDISKSKDDQNLELTVKNIGACLFRISKLQKTKSEELRYLKSSLVYYELSLSLVQKYKMILPREDQQLIYSDLNKRKYPNIIQDCYICFKKTGDKIYAEKAFEYAEKSKASLLLSMVQSVNAQQMNLVPDELIQKEEQTREQSVRILKSRTDEYKHIKPDYSKIDKLSNTLLRLNDRQDSIMAVVKEKYKTYYDIKYNVKVINTFDLQKLLAPNEAILQYTVTWDYMYIFILTKNNFKIFTDTTGKEFFEDIEKYRQHLNRFDYADVTDTSVNSFAELSNRLYNHLIKPANQYIKGKKLLVIPDDVLNQVPFEPLIEEIPDKSKKTGFKDFEYLFRHHTINYCFSATLFSLNHQRTTCKNAALLAVAPGYEGVETKYITDVHQGSHYTDISQLSALNGAYNEVKDLCNLFRGTTLIKNGATKERFRKIAGRYDILHLAMHGAINNESPMLSKLIFSPGKNSASESFLNTYEIYNMHIHAPLVVLSACNTGSGKLHTGEGIISLARSFFTAGAKCVVMTLWSVTDNSSSQLMNLFYRHLGQKESVDEAMQSAKLDYLNGSDKISSYPYFWAGYISTGNAEVSFEVEKNMKLKYILIISGIILLLISLWYKFLR